MCTTFIRPLLEDVWGAKRVKKKFMQNEQLVFKNMLKKSNHEQPRSLLAFLFQLSQILYFQKLDQYYCYLVDQLLNQLSCTRFIITKFHSILKKRYLVILIRPHTCIIFAMGITSKMQTFKFTKSFIPDAVSKWTSHRIISGKIKQFCKVLTLTIPNHLNISITK